MAGHGGGAWKVAYADFVTAMMAFFLVMWITAQSAGVKESVATYFRDPYLSWKSPGSASPTPGNKGGAAEMSHTPTGPRARGRAFADPGPKAQGDPNDAGSSQTPVLNVRDGDRSSIGTVVLFDHQSAELSQPGRRRLEQLIPLLAGKRSKIEIRGHTSRRPPSADAAQPDPWQLCFARCVATMRFLEEAGIEPTRLRLSQAGPFEPTDQRGGEEGLAQNSRVEVYMLDELVDEVAGGASTENDVARSH